MIAVSGSEVMRQAELLAVQCQCLPMLSAFNYVPAISGEKSSCSGQGGRKPALSFCFLADSLRSASFEVASQIVLRWVCLLSWISPFA